MRDRKSFSNNVHRFLGFSEPPNIKNNLVQHQRLSWWGIIGWHLCELSVARSRWLFLSGTSSLSKRERLGWRYLWCHHYRLLNGYADSSGNKDRNRHALSPFLAFTCFRSDPIRSDRFVETSKRRDEYLKTFEPEEQEEGDGEEGEEIFQKEATEAKVNREGDDDKAADASVVTVGRGVETRDDRRTSAAPAEGQGRGENNSPVGKGKVGAVTGNAAKDSRDRQAERDLIEEQLDKEATVIFNEMKECMIFHDLY